MPGPRIFLSAAEVSGDLLGAEVIREIRKREPAAECAGLGGPAMIAEGLSCRRDMLDLAGMLTDFLGRVPAYGRLILQVAREFRRAPPDVFVPIDSPGLHLLLARAARLARVPVAYYVSPQIWAWGPWRISKIRRRVARILCLFRFEERIYREGGVPVSFVGHPLVDRVAAFSPEPGFLASLGAEGRVPVAFFPGSRERVLERNLPAMAAAAAAVQTRHPEALFLVPSPDEALRARASEGLAALRVDHRAFVGRSFDALAACEVALVSSGTGSLEAALFGRPMVVVYALGAFDWVMRGVVLEREHVSLPNILAGDGVVPEFVHNRDRGGRIAEAVLRLIEDPKAREAQRAAFERVRDQLGPRGAAGRAADAILEVARAWR